MSPILQLMRAAKTIRLRRIRYASKAGLQFTTAASGVMVGRHSESLSLSANQEAQIETTGESNSEKYLNVNNVGDNLEDATVISKHVREGWPIIEAYSNRHEACHSPSTR